MRAICPWVVLLFVLAVELCPMNAIARDKSRVPLPWVREFSVGANNKDTSYIRKATKCCQAADAFMAEGKFDSAVGEYQAAATINPERERYKELYKSAIERAQEFHLTRGEQAEREKDLAFALNEYNAVSKHRPNLVARAKARQVEDAIKILQDAFAKLSFQSPDGAYLQVLQLLNKWPTNQVFAKKLEELRRQIFNSEIDKAKSLLNTDFQWNEAHKVASKLMERAPGYPAAQKIFDEATRRMQAHTCFLAGKKTAASGQWKKAVVHFQECLSNYAQYPKGKQQLDRAISAVSSQIISQANRAEMEGDWRAVVTAYSELLTYRPDSAKYQEKLRVSKTKWAKILLADGDRLIKKDYFGMGFVYHLMAMSQDSSLYDLQHGLKVLRNRIRQRIQKRVYVKSFVNNTKNPHVGGLLASSLSQYITNAAPDTVKLVSSSRDDNVLMTGLVTTCEVNTQKQTGSKTVRYQAGMRFVPNPRYQQIIMQLQQAENDVITSAGIAATDAQFRYEQLQRTLAATPPQIEQPDYAVASHPVYTWTLTAKLALNFKVIDSISGNTILQRQVADSYQTSDQMVQPDPEKGVAEDPLELPDDEVVIRQLIDKTAKKLEAITKGFFDSIEVSYLNRANALANKNKRKAVEEYVNHIFAARNKTTIEEKVFTYIANACELPAHITLRRFIMEQVSKD